MSEFSTGQPVMAEQINRLNKIVVLNIIRQEKEISRADIVKKTGLSAPTVTRIVESLIHKEQLVVQVGVGESSGGRPPVIVRFNAESNYVVGIDWGRTHINGIIADLNGNTILQNDLPVNSETSFEEDIAEVTHLINQLIEKSGINQKKILGIGLAVAGFINKNTGNVEYSPNFGWSKLNIKEVLQDHFDIPIHVDNVSRVMALGELCYGQGMKYQNFVFVNVGFGIGSGVIINEKAYDGYDGFAGEIGHLKVKGVEGIQHTPTKCACGKTDCLENFVSGRGIAEGVRREIDEHTDSLIYKLIEGEKSKISTELIAKAANEGDAYALSVFEKAAVLLAANLANVSNILNPQAIILGGKVMKSGAFFFEKIQSVFNQEVLPNVSRPVQLIKSELIGQAAVKGAIALILKEILELNVNHIK